jgi:hypothetical protein
MRGNYKKKRIVLLKKKKKKKRRKRIGIINNYPYKIIIINYLSSMPCDG